MAVPVSSSHRHRFLAPGGTAAARGGVVAARPRFGGDRAGLSGAAPRRTSPRNHGVRRERVGGVLPRCHCDRLPRRLTITHALVAPTAPTPLPERVYRLAATTFAGGRGSSRARMCGNVPRAGRDGSTLVLTRTRFPAPRRVREPSRQQRAVSAPLGERAGQRLDAAANSLGRVPYAPSTTQSMTPTTPTIIRGIAKILAAASAPRPYAPARGGVGCLVVA